MPSKMYSFPVTFIFLNLYVHRNDQTSTSRMAHALLLNIFRVTPTTYTETHRLLLRVEITHSFAQWKQFKVP